MAGEGGAGGWGWASLPGALAGLFKGGEDYTYRTRYDQYGVPLNAYDSRLLETRLNAVPEGQAPPQNLPTSINPWAAVGGIARLTNPAAGNPLPPTPGQPGTPGGPPDDWRDYADLAGRLVLEVWQRFYDQQRQKQYFRALAKAQRAAWLRFQQTAARASAPVVTAGRATNVPYPNTSILGFSGETAGGGVSSWGNLLGGVGLAAGSIISALSGNDAGSLAQYGDPWGPDILYSDASRAQAALNASLAGGCGSPFVAGGSALRPATFSMTNPATGKQTWFRPAGRPILWSSDLGACRRVNRIARKARRRSGGR